MCSNSLREVYGVDVAFQDSAVPISWLVVVWLLPTAIPLESTEPDVVGRIGWVNDAWCIWKKGSVPVHIVTPPVVAVI